MGICVCPPFLSRAWRLGKARQAKEEKRRRSVKTVLAAMEKKPRYIFEETVLPHWTELSFDEMSVEQRDAATETWRRANLDASVEEAPVFGCQPRVEQVASPAPGGDEEAALDADEIRDNMLHYMRKALKWTPRDLHDALIGSGNPAPNPSSMLQYYKHLRALYGDSHAATPMALSKVLWKPLRLD